jgi:hypothetical protein
MLLKTLRAKGGVCDLTPEILAGILRAIVLMFLHEDEIGEKVFGPAMELMLSWISEGLVGGGHKS